MKTEKEIAAYNVIREQHRQLGPMSFGELSVLGLFILLVVLWFTREPGFVDGWATDIFNSKAEFVHIHRLFVILEYTQTLKIVCGCDLFAVFVHSSTQICDRCHGGCVHRRPSLRFAL